MTTYMKYWKPETADWELRQQGVPFRHSASNQYDKVHSGDIVWLVTVRTGNLSLLGRICVDVVTDQRKAARILRTTNSALWEADYHAIGREGTLMPLVEVPIASLASRLRFETDAPRDRLKIVYGRVNAQQLQMIRVLTPESAELLQNAWDTGNGLPSEAPEAPGGTEYLPDDGDTREEVLRQIRARRGQPAFREALRRRYGDRCLISGCGLMDIVDAAHIRPYRAERDNHEENGLLLRTDLHTLFDLDLLGIEPGTLLVHLHPAAARTGYRMYAGRKLNCRRPSHAALQERWQAFTARLTGSS